MTIRNPLLLLIVCALLAGCSQDQYFLERKYYRVQERAKAILKNPEATPPNELTRSVDELEEFLVKYPKTNIAVDSQFRIVQLYTATKEYDKAHAQLNKIMSVFKDSDVIRAEALFTHGAVYEDAKNLVAAMEQYQRVIREYPITPRGLDTPFYIAMNYKNKLQPDKMITSLREAIAHYSALAAKYPVTPLSLRCHTMEAQCFLELKEGENAIRVLQATIEEFKGKVPPSGMLLDIGTIYYGVLKDPAKAIGMFNQVIKEFPKTEAARVAEGMLDKIKKETK